MSVHSSDKPASNFNRRISRIFRMDNLRWGTLAPSTVVRKEQGCPVIPRNTPFPASQRWPVSAGTGGRFQPESVAGSRRITHSGTASRESLRSLDAPSNLLAVSPANLAALLSWLSGGWTRTRAAFRISSPRSSIREIQLETRAKLCLIAQLSANVNAVSLAKRHPPLASDSRLGLPSS